MLIGKASDCSDGLAEWMGAECLETVPVGVASMGMMEGVISEGSEMADATGGACDEWPGQRRHKGGWQFVCRSIRICVPIHAKWVWGIHV